MGGRARGYTGRERRTMRPPRVHAMLRARRAMEAGNHEDLVRHRRSARVNDGVVFVFALVVGIGGLARGLWGWAVFSAVLVASVVFANRRVPELVVARLRSETLELDGLTRRHRLSRHAIHHVGFGTGRHSGDYEQSIRWRRDFGDPVSENAGRSRFVVVEAKPKPGEARGARFAIRTGSADEADAFVAEVRRWLERSLPEYRAPAYAAPG